MTILGSDFDFDAIKRARARRAASGGVDLETALNQISPDIGKLKVGQTAQLDIPKDMGLRKFVMSITAKLNNITVKGQAWAGRTFRVASDGEGHVFVQRGEDAKAPRVAQRRTGGGPKPAGSKTTQAADGKALVTENA